MDAIKVYHQKYMDKLLEDDDFARDMGLEPRKKASIYDDDDEEMGEYDEEAELDMMFPNREDDDDWDDL